MNPEKDGPILQWPMKIALASGVPIDISCRSEQDHWLVTWTTAVPIAIDYERGIIYMGRENT